MKIDGRSFETGLSSFALRRGDGGTVVLRLRSLPLGFHRKLRQRGIVAPLPPARVARDSAGRPQRDPQGLALLVPDEADPDYRDQLEQYHQRVAVLMAAEALAADPQVEFETPAAPEADDWRPYADALYGELERSGWTAGDLIRICREICRLSNLLDEDLEQARAGFSPAAREAEP